MLTKMVRARKKQSPLLSMSSAVSSWKSNSGIETSSKCLYLSSNWRISTKLYQNDKRSIRRKAKKLSVRNGEIFYKRKGNEVRDT